ncbi:hypothetical protein B0H13DRAFT_1897456 [Mycena leptocephala]|nr:hypothetical protein B0H13DRAFT_1897456 [Mycena leptocephala]
MNCEHWGAEKKALQNYFDSVNPARNCLFGQNFLNVANHLVIAAAALNNDPKFAGTKNLAILLSLAPDRAGSKYEHRTFFIDRVLLLKREESNAAATVAGWMKGSHKDAQEAAERTGSNHFKLMAGWCSLPGGEVSGTQMWMLPASYAAEHVLPRASTSTATSHTISDADLEAAEMPAGWREYMKRQHLLLSGLKGGQGIIGYVHADGTREPVYKYGNGGHFRRCVPGETETDGPEEFKKPLVDPSKMVRLISKHLASYEHVQLNSNNTVPFESGQSSVECYGIRHNCSVATRNESRNSGISVSQETQSPTIACVSFRNAKTQNDRLPSQPQIIGNGVRKTL